MGDYYLVVNPVKRQYLDPARFGEAIKFHSVLEGGRCIRAFELLIADGASYPGTKSFRGAWLGDPVILASDDGGPPNPFGFTTVTPDRPWRNLNKMAHDEFRDISYRAIAELCLHDNDNIREFIDRAKDDSSFFIDLANVRLQYRLPSLEHTFLETFGKAWRKEYDKISRECHYWQPLPPIDWPL
jgi:hypothetical protein